MSATKKADPIAFLLCWSVATGALFGVWQGSFAAGAWMAMTALAALGSCQDLIDAAKSRRDGQ